MATIEQIKALTLGAKIETDMEEFLAKLTGGKKLRVKYGIDPTGSHVHFGHTVPLRIMRRFQELGHEAHLIIGDFTASIGDPSGRNEGRPPLTPEQIKENMETYLEQIGKFIDLNEAMVWHNSDWLEGMNLSELVREFSLITVQRMLDRKDFSKRINDHTPVYLHELIYPMVQGIDSREIQADIELGGTEQLYTLLLARDIQQRAGQQPQTCITVPILRGTDGVKRMGKSLGNFIGVNEPPLEIFGKTMSIPDDLMDEWLMLLTSLKLPNDLHPRKKKLLLAFDLASQAHGQEMAEKARDEWLAQYSFNQDPEDISEIEVNVTEMLICPLLVALGMTQGTSEAKRLIVPVSGVTIGPDKTKVTDPKMIVPLVDGLVVRIGKRRIVRVKVVLPI